MNDTLEDTILDIGVDAFKNANVVDTLQKDMEESLYPGCKSLTRLSVVLILFNLKARGGWTDKSFTELLELLQEILLEGIMLSNHSYEAKKIFCLMSLDYVRIHVCRDDCILYRKEYENLKEFPRYGESRYKKKANGIKYDDSVTRKSVHSKVMWYLPIIQRFRRLFSNVNDINNTRWNIDERVCHGKIRHVADLLQWKKIDSLFPNFALEARNLRLGLATNGMNPFGNLSTNNTSWSVPLIIYNLSIWLCMKRKYMMLSMMISGLKQPGNDIDVYLTPLVGDLILLWEEDVNVDDAYTSENFKLCAMLFCLINDFLAYDNFSGYNVKGHKVCPICEFDKFHHQLQNGKKTVYLGHQIFLRPNHPYDRLQKAFDMEQEFDFASKPLIEKEVYKRQQHIKIVFRKKQKFDGTVLNIKGKTKDTKKSREDMGIKVPQGYLSNVKKLVSNNDHKLVGLKSHDYHILMQQLLPVAIHGILPRNIRVTITRLCLFFNVICSKIIDSENLDELEHEAAIILCQLEMFFSPSFFDIMVHLVVHLVREIRICGPVYLRWMHPIERYMKIFKGYTQNHHRLEASIVERYITEETIEFCTMYLSKGNSIGTPKSRHEGRYDGRGTTFLFQKSAKYGSIFRDMVF
ncbi:uncharacterized protein LOC127129795 [Lathyrus oleraceus]|uniref:uncharacterized protein LOC127129795 n=1 Tax=Pisum sativum TaxID=3888 RepID=UPI0021CF5564|nr:uncharacterized protein LOC127129795 [Pisum sativum]